MNNDKCAVCELSDVKLFRCSQCKNVYYCSKSHQRRDWKKNHKAQCTPYQGDIRQDGATSTSRLLAAPLDTETPQEITQEHLRDLLISPVVLAENLLRRNGSTITNLTVDSSFTEEGSSEAEILNARTETLRTFNLSGRNNGYEPLASFSEISLEEVSQLKAEQISILEEVSKNVVHDMDKFGVCVVDHFLGPEMGLAVLKEVEGMYKKGVFRDGQTVSSTGDVRNIRRDKITWLDGKESQCKNIGTLITRVDTVVQYANKMRGSGEMGSYVITGRTKAMVACYPASGSHYVKHVDNPNHDGRCITAIYYLNKDWDITKDGGLLRIFPESWEDRVADIEPVFDRILFFWSDRRNPHEVQPSHRTRYAITLWYFDENEREEATKKHLRPLPPITS